MTTTVNDIDHIESQSYNGVAVIKVFFHEGAKVEAGVAPITSIAQTLLRIMPPGTTPPLILQYSASNVPILQLGLTSKTLSEQDLYDLGLNFIRTQLATVQGAQVPLPYGGKSRQIMAALDPAKLYGKGLSPADVSNAINVQNVILPAGTQKIGDREYNVRLNSSPEVLQVLNDLPIKQVNGAVVYIRDVAQVRDGFAVQTNIVAQNRIRSALLTVLKSASASTIDIIKRVKEALPRIQATLPKELEMTQLFDQSIFVRAAINGVLREGVIAACLTALMILLFLGNWRSTLVVATSIPLSILCSIIVLGALVQTMNIMMMSGHLEEIDTSLAHGLGEHDGSDEKIDNRREKDSRARPPGAPQPRQPLGRVSEKIRVFLFGIHESFNRVFEKIRDRYVDALRWCLGNRKIVFIAMGAMVLISLCVVPFLGRDFFPVVDAGQFRLHVRAPAGTRLEATEERFYQVGRAIREVIPPDEIDNVLDNIGLPTSGINLAFSDNATIGEADGEILVALTTKHRRTAQYMHVLREKLHRDFPDMEFFFAAPDIVSQILNFGIPAPIDIQV